MILLDQPDGVQKYYSGIANSKPKHPLYAQTVEQAQEMSAHVDGVRAWLQQLLDQAYPNEPKEIKEYRLKNINCETRALFAKVHNCLAKIAMSDEKTVDYTGHDAPKVLGKDTLQAYTEGEVPVYDTLHNLLWQKLVPVMYRDANAVLLFLPRPVRDGANEFPDVSVRIVPSSDVFDFVDGEVLTIAQKSKDTNTVEKYTIIDSRDMHEVVVKDNKVHITSTPHNCGGLPAFRVGGKPTIWDAGFAYSDTLYYENFFSDVLPFWNEMVRLENNLMAAYRMHVFPEYEAIYSDECHACRGTGQYIESMGDSYVMVGGKKVCGTCRGKGYEAISPFGNRSVRPPSSADGQQPLPFPTKVYIPKQIDIVTKIEEAIEAKRIAGFSAINFEFLARVPEQQSGVAKQFDRAEFNAFVASIAKHIYEYILRNTYYYTAWARYGGMVAAGNLKAADVAAMLPSVSAPKRIDLITANIIAEEIKLCRDAGIVQVAITGLNREYVQKQFESDPGAQQQALLCIEHDPLPGMDVAEKANQVLAKTVRKQDAVLSNYIIQFVTRALEEHEDFASLDYMAQHKILEVYAVEYIPAEAALGSLDGQLTPMDEAAANRAAQVGGLTGMIEIVNAVASGVYDLDAAIALVTERFGVDEATARRQLGTPSTEALNKQQKPIQQ